MLSLSNSPAQKHILIKDIAHLHQRQQNVLKTINNHIYILTLKEFRSLSSTDYHVMFGFSVLSVSANYSERLETKLWKDSDLTPLLAGSNCVSCYYISTRDTQGIPFL